MPKQIALKNVKLAKGLEYKGVFPKDAKFMYAEVKKDGLRGFAYKGKLYTSSGVLVVNAPEVEAALKLIPKIAKNYVLDAEFYYKNCRTTLSIVKTQTPDHKLRDKVKMFVFDIISKKEWDAKIGTVMLKRRKVNLVIAIAKLRRAEQKLGIEKKDSAIQVFKSVVIEPTDKAVQEFHREACKAGHEGTMIKNPMSVYSFRKNRDWQKLKPYRESDLVIYDAKLGTAGKKNGTRLGRLWLKGIIDGKKVKTRCGGGFKDHERESLWKMHKAGKLVGKVVEIEHEGLTRKNAVRFPQFRRLHPEKNR